MEEVYFVELINRTAPDDELGDVYEVSVSCGEGEFVKDDELGDYCEDFERNYYISEQMFLSESMEQFVYGKEIDSDEFDEMGGYSEYDFSKWYKQEYFKTEKEAMKCAENLITQVKKGDWT